MTHFRRLGNAAWASLRNLANATPNGWPKRLAAVGRPNSHPRNGLARQPGLAIQSWPALRPLAAPVCPSTAECPLLVLTTTVLLGPGSCSGATPPSLSQGRPDSTQFRKLGKAAWASLRKLANATPTDWPKRLAAAGRPDSHPRDGLARQPGLALKGLANARLTGSPSLPFHCGLSTFGAVETGPSAAWADWTDWRALRPLPCPSLLMARASGRRPLLAGTSAAQAGSGELASATPPARPVGFAAAGRPNAKPPEGLATWTGPALATWPTSGPLVAPVHSTLRAAPNPHPTADLRPSLLERDDGLDRSPSAVDSAGPSRSESQWGCSSAARTSFLAPFYLRCSLQRTQFGSRGNPAL